MACELAAYFYLELGQKDKALELFLLAHEKYHEWGAFGKCTSLFEFVTINFTSFIGSGLTLMNSNDSMGQEAAAVAAPSVNGGLLSSLNSNDSIRQEAAVAAPNVNGGLFSSLNSNDSTGQEAAVSAPNVNCGLFSSLNSNDSIGQEAAVAAPNVNGSLFSFTNTSVNMGQETAAPAAAPNMDDGLLSSLDLDDVLQRYSAS